MGFLRERPPRPAELRKRGGGRSALPQEDREIGAGRPRPWVIYGLGSLLLVFNAYAGTYTYVVVQALIWTQTSLLRGPIVVLFALALANLAAARLARRYAMRQSELIVLYSMLAVATCAAGIGFVQFLVNQLPAFRYMATPSNGWQTRLWPYVPGWLVPSDPHVLRGFFRGDATLYSAAVLRVWAVPVAAWSAFIFGLFWVLLCVMALFRRQWVDRERLTFPLVYLPLEMTRGAAKGSLWTSWPMWAGFALAGLVESVNYVSYLYPSVPSIPIKPIGPNALDLYITAPPWNALGMFRLAFYPFALGIGYLLSVDVSFSCWSFYLLRKAAMVASAALGFSQPGGAGAANRAPYLREQAVGAFIAIALFSVWMARTTFADLWRHHTDRRDTERCELIPGRTAIVGGGLGALFLIGFLVAAGLAPSIAALFIAVYLCFAVTLARIVSEAGAGWAWGPDWSATSFVSDAIGSQNLAARQIVVLHGFTGWTYDMRDNPAPQYAQTAKMQSSANMRGSLLGPLLWAAAFGILCAFWAHLDIYYRFGAASAKVRPWLQSIGTQSFRQASAALSEPTPSDSAGLIAACAGGLISLALCALRLRFAGWPLHPLGYALGTTQSMDYMWFPFFVACTAKWFTLRYGGMRAYRAGLPFALGLILGDYVVPTLWGVYGMLGAGQQYMAFPH